MVPHLRLFRAGSGRSGPTCEDGDVSEQAGRYQRSTAGLIGAILITLAVITAFVVFRSLFREQTEREPEPVDWLASVGYAQESGAEVVYPRSVPDSWTATSVDSDPGDPPAWGLGFLTGDTLFVGLRHEDASLDDLLETYVEEEAGDLRELEEQQLDSEVAGSWQVFEDTGGDRAYAAEVGDRVVLVYGSAPAEDLELVVERLTTDPR